MGNHEKVPGTRPAIPFGGWFGVWFAFFLSMSSGLFARSFVCMFELSPVSFAFVNIPVELQFSTGAANVHSPLLPTRSVP